MGPPIRKLKTGCDKKTSQTIAFSAVSSIGLPHLPGKVTAHYRAFGAGLAGGAALQQIGPDSLAGIMREFLPTFRRTRPKNMIVPCRGPD